MTLAEGKTLAAEICSLIQNRMPTPIRMLVVGSIRRGKAEVGDIDIVVEKDSLQWDAMRWVFDIAPVIEVDKGGAEMLACTYKGQHVDLYRAHPATATAPSNWGSLVICRTGSKNFNIWLAGTAKKMGRRWQPHEGIYRLFPDGSERLIASATEEDVFAAVGWSYVKPEERSI